MMKRSFSLLIASALALSTLSCTEAEDDPPPANDVIKILAPAAGASFKLTDDVLIIAESDYTKFASGINVQYSNDEGKTWNFMKSKVRKEGIEKDTLIWNFSTEMPGAIAPGSKVGFQVLDYNKKFIKTSPFVTFTN